MEQQVYQICLQALKEIQDIKKLSWFGKNH